MNGPAYRYRVHSFRVVDGDTIDATIDQGFRTLRQETFRLARINTPEMNTAGGRAAKAALVVKLGSSPLDLVLVSIKTEKYGRWLAELYLGDENVNDWLVSQGYAKPYGAA